MEATPTPKSDTRTWLHWSLEQSSDVLKTSRLGHWDQSEVTSPAEEPLLKETSVSTEQLQEAAEGLGPGF